MSDVQAATSGAARAASDPELAEAIAQRVAELVAARPPRLLTVEQVAEMLQVKPEWVYEHAGELGALRLGGGARGRLRFELEQVRERLRAQAAGPQRPVRARPRRAPRPRPADGPLLRVGPKRDAA
ncbi:helix-turn-helix domain-containing protein [Conexibacter sp. CPCC 206217]|uniref:helix-turn-helix domain-containing protein n=1 Tax=Conexibacter sp. CPCC 206217 TaxID=3064574 RepID=UPI002728BA90|nr:helix-turn-helix domain-containing protein [Conexibacter sp. CPCC 206217]MDO8209272.1 helix-turn-helix domain-containing protein [Conexibacter sp. CPCC 206217]